MSKFDIIFVLPYIFSDHPSFPEGILKKALEIQGVNVGIIETPFWQDANSFKKLGQPKLFFAVISGPMDSIVLNYTSQKKRRKEDLYQHEGNAFFEGYPPSIKYKKRPDRTTIVFSNKIREAFKDAFILIGGVEASLRCFSHYDFQIEKIRRPILFDSRADILVSGIGEKQIVSIAKLIKEGKISDALNINGIAKISNAIPDNENFIHLPSFEEVLSDPSNFLAMQKMIEKAKIEGKGIIQQYANHYVIANPPYNYTTKDLDETYSQVYLRKHFLIKSYSPACRMNLFSITSHRGCFGGCSFCSITVHEGKNVISRSFESIIKEIDNLRKHPEWKGYISDVGGASAEMYGSYCEHKNCPRPSCIYPKKCDKLNTVQKYIDLLRECKKISSIKKIFIGSGVRYDLFLEYPELLEEILLYHSGRFLRVAPEHTEDNVLKLMRKPEFNKFEKFVRIFNSINKKLKRKVELSPYIMIGHPGETKKDVIEMNKKFKSLNIKPVNIQTFTPTPGTLSTAMYYVANNN
ncbi:MAG: YgiQ family radical SAM protein [Desulfobacterales bacterium]|nr:YgiQ family radical SAM protein [Desulfobacterales bacterium]MBF0397876.1 YgiQ family radical SAM protein [Desulfobacterales bacterium]